MSRPTHRSGRTALTLRGLTAVGVLLWTLVACAQPPGTDGKKKADPAKVPEAGKTEPGKGAPTEKVPIPPGGIIVLVKDLGKALDLWPEAYVLSPEKYKQLVDRLAALEKQARGDKVLAHACKLSGKLEGDYVALRAEFLFSTEAPRTTVALGLQRGHLADEGELDGDVPALDYSEEDGFSVLVGKEGNHHLTLNLRVPVAMKEAAGSGSVRRGFDLGLPGTTVTTLALELPEGIKELRWNDTTEKRPADGRWLLSAGKSKSLSVSWRAPQPVPAGGDQRTADGSVVVTLDEAQATIHSEVALQDLRGQTREWQLLVPPQAKVEVTPPAGASFQLLGPEGKTLSHVLKLAEPGFETWKVTALVKLPRPAPGTRLAVSPIHVPGAFQQGTITVHVTPDATRRHRVLYHRFGDVFQRDQPREPGETEVVKFQYWNPPPPKKGQGYRVPLEIEVRAERGRLDVSAEHSLKLRPAVDGWEAETTSRFTLKFEMPPDALELELPRRRPADVAWLASHPGVSFPAGFPWSTVWAGHGKPTAVPLDFHASEEGGAPVEIPAADASGRTRVPLPRGAARELTLLVHGRYHVAGPVFRAQFELPRLPALGGRTGKVVVEADEHVELLTGPPGAEAPGPERHRLVLPGDRGMAVVDVAWRTYRPEVPVSAVVDVTLHDRTAQVRQVMRLGGTPAKGAPGPVQLTVPPGVTAVVVNDVAPAAVPEQGRLWAMPRVREGDPTPEVSVEFDVPMQPNADVASLDVPLVWPSTTTRVEANVRVWAPSGVRVTPALPPGVWHDRGAEAVPGRSVLPALALAGRGERLALSLRVERAARRALPAIEVDRALVQVTAGDDEGDLYRARYRVRAAHGDVIDLELPGPAAEYLVADVKLGGHVVPWEAVAGNPTALRLRLAPLAQALPAVLDISYRVPPRARADWWPWTKALRPPVFTGRAAVAATRWQVSFPAGEVVLAPEGRGHADVRWMRQGLLFFPEAAAPPDRDEPWLADGSGGLDRPASTVYTRAGHEPHRLLHLPRPLWLLLCSGTALVVFLALFFLPFGRAALWLSSVLLAAAGLAAALTWPGAVLFVVAGCQPAAAVILGVLLVHWFIRERYRRQVVFIPGFTRVKAGSSLIRNGASGRRPRDASTVDAPPAPAPGDAGSATAKPS